MKRFKFSLESVLTLRRFRKTESASLLAASSRERQMASHNLDTGIGELENLENQLLMRLSGKARANEVVLIQQALQQQRSVVRDLKESFEQAVVRENKMRERVLQAKRQYETLVKLEDKQRELARKEAEHEDELNMQEFVASQYVTLKAE